MTAPPRSEPLPDGAIRVGLVGAGRRRNGLGPFLARHAEAAGMRVVGVAGRDLEGAERGATAVAAEIGRRPDAFASAESLARAVDLLVVSSPAAAHVEGLEAALMAGVACLCEKPFVLPGETARGLELVDAFAAAGLPLFENCQWPFVLPTVERLAPGAVATAPRALAMGLCPAAGGRAMILDSLSHVLSLAQALAPIDPDGQVTNVRESDPRSAAVNNELRFELPLLSGAGAERRLAVELQLERRDEQPRPAWLAIDGVRFDRRIGAGYSQSLRTNDDREEAMPDPLGALVYRVAARSTPAVASPADPTPHNRGARAHRSGLDDPIGISAIRTRLRSFAGVLAGLGRELP
ncbi:MAG: Gfo/Idh/MocA family oxidoreductase [bacterium]|nr:Gfo/Idh/MocA family oxidoreductase [bacterium]